jgi:hypothetical protein
MCASSDQGTEKGKVASFSRVRPDLSGSTTVDAMSVTGTLNAPPYTRFPDRLADRSRPPAVHERLEHVKAGPVRDRAHDGRIKQSR